MMEPLELLVLQGKVRRRIIHLKPVLEIKVAMPNAAHGVTKSQLTALQDRQVLKVYLAEMGALGGMELTAAMQQYR